MRVLMAAFCAAAIVLPGSAQSRELGYQIKGRIINGEFPSRPVPLEPIISYQVYESEAPKPEELALLAGAPIVKLDRTHHSFLDTTPHGLSLANAHIFFDVRVEGFILRRPETTMKEIPRHVDALGTIPVEFELVRRSVLADSSRREATEALDKADPGPADFERAEVSARKAIEINPTLDNYLNLFDIIRKANRSDYPELISDFHTAAALASLPGYHTLTFEEQWRLRRELLMTLVRMPDHEASLGFGATVREAAIAVGREMVEGLSPSQDYRELPVIEVFRALSMLHTTNGDCPSLIDNNALAIAVSANAAMNWGSQRLFLLEWADCLLLRSGIGDGRSNAQFVSDAVASPVLSEEWARFARAAGAVEANFAFPTSDADARLLGEYRRAQSIASREEAQ